MHRETTKIKPQNVKASKISLKYAPKYQMNWGNNWKTAQTVRKASNFWHKLDAFLTIWAISSIISSINPMPKGVFYGSYILYNIYFSLLVIEMVVARKMLTQHPVIFTANDDKLCAVIAKVN